MQEHQFGILNLLEQSGFVGTGVFAILVLMSVASWYLIVVRVLRAWKMSRLARNFVEGFAETLSVDALLRLLSNRVKDEPYARVAAEGVRADRYFKQSVSANDVAAGAHDAFVTAAIRRSIARETASCEVGLAVLASVGSTAPFVGLFGTVWGIYHALVAIAASGNASLDSVAGPVGEALIMTAMGLVVAIPAVLGYNFLVRRNRAVAGELNGFAHDLHTLLTTGSQPGPLRQAEPATPAVLRTGVA